MGKSRMRLGPTKRRNKKTNICRKCRRKFRIRRRNRVLPNLCYKPVCQTWGKEQASIRESIARLSSDLRKVNGGTLKALRNNTRIEGG